MESSNKYSLCETNPVTWNDKLKLLRNNPTKYKDPIAVNTDENEDEAKAKAEATSIRQRLREKIPFSYQDLMKNSKYSIN